MITHVRMYFSFSILQKVCLNTRFPIIQLSRKYGLIFVARRDNKMSTENHIHGAFNRFPNFSAHVFKFFVAFGIFNFPIFNIAIRLMR